MYLEQERIEENIMTVTYRGKEYPSEEFLPGVRDKMSTRSLVLAASHETIDYY